MAEFFKAVEAAGGAEIFRELFLDPEKFICFTRFSKEEGQWTIGVSDGISIWKTELTEHKVKEHGELTITVKGISQALQDGETQLLGSHDHLKLSIRYSATPTKQLDLLLYQSSDVQLRVEMKRLVFSLLVNLQSTRRKLKVCESDLLEAKTKYAPISTGYGDAIVSGSTAAKAPTTSKQKKTKGSSLVNPSSKRRKAATGVVFDEDKN